MASVKNRITTIVGSDAKPYQMLGRLLFYAWASNLPWVLFKKLFRIQTAAKTQLKALAIPTFTSPAHINFGSDTSKQPLVSIIIPTRNQTRLLKQCIDSIIQHSIHTRYEIIVVDNQSTEQSFFDLISEYQHQLGDSFSCLKADYAFNFSAIVNLGCQKAKGEHLLLLNNDTQVITPDWLNILLAYSTLPEIGAVGCKLLYPDYTIQHAGILVYSDGTAKHEHVGLPRHATEVVAIRSFAAMTAAALMIKKTTYIAINGFDEMFKVEFNDIDFCLRLQEQGYVNLYIPQVELLHYESASRRHPLSSPKSYKRFKAELALMHQKHGH